MAPTFIANNPDTEQCAQLEVGTGYASPYRTPPIYTQNKTPSTFPVHAEDFYCKTHYRGKGVLGCGRRFGCCGCGWGPAWASNDSGALESICVCVMGAGLQTLGVPHKSFEIWKKCARHAAPVHKMSLAGAVPDL
jgi:hypothetical protein